jgi:hypothetical protein
MATKQDVTSLTMKFTNEKISRLRTALGKKITTGPTNTQMSNREARLMFQSMSQESKQAYIQSIGGFGAWDKMMGDLYGKQT